MKVKPYNKYYTDRFLRNILEVVLQYLPWYFDYLQLLQILMVNNVWHPSLAYYCFWYQFHLLKKTGIEILKKYMRQSVSLFVEETMIRMKSKVTPFLVS